MKTKKKIMQERSFEMSIVGRLHLRNKKEDVWRLFTPPLECGIVVVDIRITFAVYILILIRLVEAHTSYILRDC